jgi:hypothetical protein
LSLTWLDTETQVFHQVTLALAVANAIIATAASAVLVVSIFAIRATTAAPTTTTAANAAAAAAAAVVAAAFVCAGHCHCQVFDLELP